MASLREQKIAKARELREQGLKFREIAELMRLPSPQTAWALVNAEKLRDENLRRNAQKRAHEHRNRAACPICGEQMHVGSKSPSRSGGKCWNCERSKRRRERRTRDDQIVALWNEGLSLQEIAARTGRTANSIATAMVRLRKEGRDLPYRQKPVAA